MDPKKWKSIKKSLWLVVFALTSGTAIISGFLWSPKAAFVTVLGSLCLASGFFITELLIGVMTGVKRANPAAIALLMLGKFGWWAGLFWLSRHLNSEVQLPLAMGMGSFLFSLVLVVLLQYGMPKISDAN